MTSVRRFRSERSAAVRISAADNGCSFCPGEAFVATEQTRGPWSERHQHGGPGAALLAAAFERAAAPLSVARMTLEILRPIPIGRVELEMTDEGIARQIAVHFDGGPRPVGVLA